VPVRLRGLLALTACSLVAVSSTSATAGGGRTIAEAPQIALGQQQLNSLNGIDFYRVALRTGDHLTLRYGPQHQYNWAEICLFQPGVSDTTVGNQPCYASKHTLSEDSFTVTARMPGDWVIAMVPYPGCERNGIIDLRCTTGLQYFLTAYVKHETTMTLRAPNAIRHGSWLSVSGHLGGAAGLVVLDRSWDSGRHWSAFALKRVGSNGGFSARLRVRRTGTLRVRASFPEAPLYAASAATVSVRVV
jgi:hypothetical protein